MGVPVANKPAYSMSAYLPAIVLFHGASYSTEKMRLTVFAVRWRAR